MGKRELLLIVVFVVVGVGVYQMTAPAGPQGTGFSIGKLIEHVRDEIRGQPVEAAVVRSATAAAPASVTTVRVDGFRGLLTILGEARDDIAAELQTTAFGADDAQARAFEKEFALTLTPNGELIDLKVKGAGPGMRNRRRVEVTVRVPERLRADLMTLGGELKVSRVAAVVLRRGSGRGSLSEIGGAVEGEFGPGSLEVDRVRSVKLETERTDLRVSNVTEAATLNATGNRLRLQAVAGPSALTLERVEAEGEDLRGPVTVTGEGGEIRLRAVGGRVDVKGERLTVRMTLDRTVPVTAVIENDFIEMALPRDGGLNLDARVEGGQLRLPSHMLEVKTSEGQQHAEGPIRGGGPQVKLHTTHGDIIVR
jgi:hypothetical protein